MPFCERQAADAGVNRPAWCSQDLMGKNTLQAAPPPPCLSPPLLPLRSPPLPPPLSRFLNVKRKISHGVLQRNRLERRFG